MSLNKEQLILALKCLQDNGIEADECCTVLQSLCYILLDEEYGDLLFGECEEEFLQRN